GFELWTTDGTASGTHMIFDSQPGADPPTSSFVPPTLGFAGDHLLIAAFESADTGRHLWVSDPPYTQAHRLSNLYTTEPLVRNDYSLIPASPSTPDGRIFFAGYGPETNAGIELWITDGTPEGTHLVADITPGPASSAPTEFLTVGSTLYFSTGFGSST